MAQITSKNGDAILDLDAYPPPKKPPHSKRFQTVSAYLPVVLAAQVHQRAKDDGRSINAMLTDWITAELDGTAMFPPDVVMWLRKQAAQCGCPGDTRQALVETVRHLARRWPDGGRLRDDPSELP